MVSGETVQNERTDQLCPSVAWPRGCSTRAWQGRDRVERSLLWRATAARSRRVDGGRRRGAESRYELVGRGGGGRGAWEKLRCSRVSAHEALVTPHTGSRETHAFFLEVQENLLLIFIKL